MSEQVSNAMDQSQQGNNAPAAVSQQDRSVNPVDSAPKGQVSAALNSDSAKYKNPSAQ